MWKKIILGIIIVIVVLVIIIMLSLDHIVKAGIERFAPQVLGTGVSVSSVHISPWSGNGAINGLKIENPKGFKAKYIFQAKRISVDLDVGSLFSNTIIIHSINIESPHIVYETGLGGSNINALQNNIQSATANAAKSTGQTKQTEPAKPGKQVVIESLVINGAKVTGSIGFVGTTASLPKIEMKDIGRGGGMSYAQATQLVFGAIIKSLTSIDLNSIGKPIGKAADTIKAVGKGIGEGVGDVGKGVGNVIQGIFGGSSDKEQKSGSQ